MKSYLTRKHSIIVSALEIIDLLGIDGLSLRELAKREGIVEGALYKHFKNKEEILLSVIDYYARYDSNIKNTIENNSMTPKEGIMFFIKSFAELFESEPSMACIMSSYEVLLDENAVVKRVKKIFILRSDFLTQLIEKGQREGSISSDFSGEDLSDIVMGLLRTITLKWRITNYGFPLKASVVSALESLLLRF
jgi:AcrR family transcriptional regulator